MKKLLILGTGAYATALANNFSENFEIIYLYGISEKEINDINENNMNETYFKDIKLSKNIIATKDIEIYLSEVECILIALPSQVIPEVLKEKIIPNIKHSYFWINASKGFDIDYKITDDYIDLIVPEKYVKSNYKIIGGTFAYEMVQKLPSKLTMTSKKYQFNENVINQFSSSRVKIEWSDDYISISIFSVMKNIYAIFQGILEGLGYKKNTQTYLMLETLKETNKIIKFISNSESDIEMNSFLSSAILGDFILTGTSSQSRNYSFGFEIAKNNNWDYHKNVTVEGYVSLDNFYKSNPEMFEEFKILKFLSKVIFEKTKPKEIIETIL